MLGQCHSCYYDTIFERLRYVRLSAASTVFYYLLIGRDGAFHLSNHQRYPLSSIARAEQPDEQRNHNGRHQAQCCHRDQRCHQSTNSNTCFLPDFIFRNISWNSVVVDEVLPLTGERRQSREKLSDHRRLKTVLGVCQSCSLVISAFKGSISAQ